MTNIPNTISVDIYTRPGCGYCEQAKSILRNKNITTNEITVDPVKGLVTKETIQNRLTTMGVSAIVKTVPQIIVIKNGKEIYIGGFKELSENLAVLDF